MIAEAPAANPLTISPDVFIPPSQINVFLCFLAARAHSSTAVIWGTPHPV